MREVPHDFEYPWSPYWQSRLHSFKRVIVRRGIGYKTRRFKAHDRKMLNRITSNKKLKPYDLGYRADQLQLF